MTPARRKPMPAFSMAEVLVSVVLVGGLLVVSLNLVGDATIARAKTKDRGRGQLLAQQLLAEIVQQAYEEPIDPVTFGREAGEGNGSRTAFDDVDDYDGWLRSPPRYRDGTNLQNLTGWARSVSVVFVAPTDLDTPVATDQGLKRIEVTVTLNGVNMASMTAIRSRSGDWEVPP